MPAEVFDRRVTWWAGIYRWSNAIVFMNWVTKGLTDVPKQVLFNIWKDEKEQRKERKRLTLQILRPMALIQYTVEAGDIT